MNPAGNSATPSEKLKGRLLHLSLKKFFSIPALIQKFLASKLGSLCLSKYSILAKSHDVLDAKTLTLKFSQNQPNKPMWSG